MNNELVVIPNFLYVGSDKSGSTWLYEMLKAQKDVHILECKDVYFFDKYYHLGLDWYLNLFSKIKESKLVGEISHDYLYDRNAMERIYNFNKEMKIIIFLRHPIDRSFSQYLYIKRSGLARGDFTETVVDHPEIVQNSMYSEYVKMYIERFGRDRVGIFLYDDLKSKPIEFAQSVLAFLGVEHFESDYGYAGARKTASYSRSPIIARMMKYFAGHVRALGLPQVVSFFKNGFLVKLLYKEYGDDRPRLAEELRKEVAVLYDEDVSALEKLLGRDLSDWRL